MQHSPEHWSAVCHLDFGEHGALVVVQHSGGYTEVRPVAAGPATGLERSRRPRIVGMHGGSGEVLLWNPVDGRVSKTRQIPADAVFAYAYVDSNTGTYWMVEDGDKDKGEDDVVCDGSGSYVTVVRPLAEGAQVLAAVCLGRGHHVPCFVRPFEGRGDIPRRAFVSNLLDGTVHVLGNDPGDAATYLKVLETINLCQAEKEAGVTDKIPNNAFPHGMVFSTVLGKIYNLNNGYRNVVTIDPLSATVERVAPMAVSSNLLLSPCGRYLIGKGVDRTRDADHVIGRISVMDAETGVMVSTMDFQDVYPSVYRFNADGSRLYVTTAATGKGTQRDNINLTDVLVFDAGQLPELCLTQRLAVGAADCGRRSLAFSPLAGRVFVPNPSDGTLTILDANNELLETVRLSEAPAKEVNFSFWQTPMYGG